jgi:hypothetical protein
MNSAGVAAPGGGGGGGSDAGTGGDYGGEGAGTGTDLVPSGDGGEVHDAEFVDGNEGQQPDRQISRGERLVENGRITQKAGRAVIDSIRSTHPAFAQPIIQALLTADRLRRELPGGFKELADLRNKIENYGGDNGLSEYKTNAETLLDLNEKFLRSDPAFINDITEDEEGKTGFVGLMPHVMARWAQLDPAGRAWWTADQLAKGLDSVRMPVLVARLADIIRRIPAEQQIPGLAESFDEMMGALESISYTPAKNKPAAPAKDPKLEDQRRQSESEIQKLKRENWQTALATRRKDLFQTTLSQLLGSRTLTAIETREVKGYYDAMVRPLATQREKNIDRYLATGDKEGYLKTEGAFYAKEIPAALRRAVQKLGPAGGKPPARQQRAAPQNQRQTAPQNGVVRVRAMPGNINPADRRNTPELIRENKGWGKDGKLYQWA